MGFRAQPFLGLALRVRKQTTGCYEVVSWRQATCDAQWPWSPALRVVLSGWPQMPLFPPQQELLWGPELGFCYKPLVSLWVGSAPAA